MAAAMIAAVLLASCATAPKAAPAGEKEAPSVTAEASAGVEVVGLRPTAGGRLLDFRFRVVDPEKAAEMLDRRTPAYLIDEATGARLEVPQTKVGRMRQNTLKPEKGRVYWMLFHPAGRRIAPGDKFTVIVGKHRFENVTVQ